jgi:hypothetical protein
MKKILSIILKHLFDKNFFKKPLKYNLEIISYKTILIIFFIF